MSDIDGHPVSGQGLKRALTPEPNSPDQVKHPIHLSLRLRSEEQTLLATFTGVLSKIRQGAFPDWEILVEVKLEGLRPVDQDRTKPKPNVTMRVVDPGFKAPERALLWDLDRKGILRDRDGNAVDEGALKKALGPATITSAKGPRYLRLSLRAEKDTSLKTLTAALYKIRMSAEPTVETVVLVVLEGVVGNAKAGK